MAGVTNPPFRTLCRRFGAGLYVSEMVSARALVEGSEKTWQLAEFGADERPRSIQLFVTDPNSVGEAVRMLIDRRDVDHIDMNFGCPVRKVTRNGAGSALPWKRKLFQTIVRSAVSAADDMTAGRVPVTIKMRIGIDDQHHTHLEAGRIAQAEGVAAIALHARTTSQWYSGRADWDEIARLKEAVTGVPILGNGDIWWGEDAVRMMWETGCDGVVVGRGCLGKPWLFRELVDAFEGRPARTAPPWGEVAEVMTEHADLLVEWVGEERAMKQFRRHTSWYCTGYPVGREIRRLLATVPTRADLAEIVATPDPTVLPAAGSESAIRGHSQGPQKAKLPEGWLDQRDDLVHVEDDGRAVSGG
ncbi:MAG: tRNA dihydrouridine synthase DusB [Actinomycetia bacterium]|nr:tRNA dihydrouridine synthase DusB [Actinomycetes bacterium]MCP4084834.1 tRNA dihydrouridine synthase DusB [Actinomycetes bacterium]